VFVRLVPNASWQLIRRTLGTSLSRANLKHVESTQPLRATKICWDIFICIFILSLTET